MAEWKTSIDVREIWKMKKEDKIDLEKFIRLLVEKIKMKESMIKRISGETGWEELEEIIYGYYDLGLIDETSNEVVPKNEVEFDRVWDNVYDWADANDIWISTF